MLHGPTIPASRSAVKRQTRPWIAPLVIALPETWLVHLICLTDDDPEMILVRLDK